MRTEEGWAHSTGSANADHSFLRRKNRMQQAQVHPTTMRSAARDRPGEIHSGCQQAKTVDAEKDSASSHRVCRSGELCSLWLGDKPSRQGGRPRKGQTLRIWTGRWGVKVCKQAPHLRSEKHFPDRSRRLSPRPFRHGQALQGWEGEGGGGGDADWKPASREMGGGAWANIHELDNEIQALKKDPDTGL